MQGTFQYPDGSEYTGKEKRAMMSQSCASLSLKVNGTRTANGMGSVS